MAFWDKLFGKSADKEPEGAVTEYKGYQIRTSPIPEGGQWRLAADINREIDGEMKAHRMIRADLFMSSDDADDAALRKARQVIDEQGDKIFDQGR